MLITSARWLHRFLYSALILIGLIFAAIVLGLRYWLLPNISDYRELIASSISQAAGQQVTIELIEGGWDGLRPHLNIRGVDVQDRSGQAALHLDHIEGTLAWWSLLFGEVRLHSLEIDQPKLALRRSAQGEIFIGGVWVNEPGNDSGFADWLMRQHRVIVRGASLTWQDELRQAPPLELSWLDLRLENRGKHHRFGLRAIPSAFIGLPFDIRGDLKGAHFDSLASWSGMLYGRMDYADIGQLQRWVDFPLQLETGIGGLQLWLGLKNGQLQSLTADLQLAEVRARLRPELPQLHMAKAGGRLSWTDLAPGMLVQSAKFGFRLHDGTTFAPASASLSLLPPGKKQAARGEMKVDGLALAPLVALSEYFPVSDDARAQLRALQIKGAVRDFSAVWSGIWPELQHYALKGQLLDLSFKPHALPSAQKLPGLSNLSGKLDLSEKGGSAQINSHQISLLFPDVFDHPVDFDDLSASLEWSNKGGAYQFKLNKAAIANSHLAGTASGSYRTMKSGPGVIDLQAHFGRADARFVSHYMPLVVGQETRDWLGRAIKAGQASDVQLRLKGDLARFPFEDGKSGLFQVAVKAHGGVLEYAAGWPAIEDISVDLLFRGKRMDVFANGGHTYGMQLGKVHAQIPDLIVMDEMLLVNGDASGATQEMLKFIANSPVSAMIDDFTESSSADGNGKFKLSLKIPLRRLDDIDVAGSYQFLNNKVVLAEGMPELERVNGVLQFTGASVDIPGMTGQFLGGPASIKAATHQGIIQINAAGKATAAGLGKAFPSPLMQRLQGSANWNGSVTLRKKLANAVFTSNLNGLGVFLPLPFNKAAGDSVMLRLERKATVLDQDMISVSYGNILAAQLERSQQAGQMKVLRGAIQIGGGAANLPANGIWLSGALPYLDIDHWRELSQGSENGGAALEIDGINFKLGMLDAFDKRFKNLNVNARRLNGAWQAELESQEMSGNINWKQEGAGKLIGRFKSLAVPEAAPAKLSNVSTQSANVEYPTLDITADKFSIQNRMLGQLELLAAPSGQDWRINKLKLTTPEASFSLDGVWLDWRHQPRTQFNVQLDTSDIGKLLTRLGEPDNVRGGKAQLKGQLSWQGRPAEINYPTLSGNLVLEAHNGQFQKIEPGLGKLLGILSLQSLPRRITLDFRDIFSEGFAFDNISMSGKANQGVFSSEDFSMDGPAARISMKGETNLALETQNLRVRVVPVLGDSVSGAAALLGGPVVGLTSLLVQKVLRDPIGQIASYEYSITGTWDNPVVTKLKKNSSASKNWENN